MAGREGLRAEIISVGTELLLGQIVDSNAAFLAQELANAGINVYHKTTVGDNWTRLAAAISQALGRSDVVITSGGLGPTEDDITKEVVAAVTGRRLVLHEEALEELKAWFARQGRTMPERNRKQAMVPEGAEMIPNHWGTAPGVLLVLGRQVVICLPGVPREFRNMVQASVIPFLQRHFGREAVIRSRTLRFCGIGESHLEERVRHLIAGSNPTVAPYAGDGEARLRITARAHTEEEAWRLIRPVQEEIEALVGEFLYGYDDDTLEGVVARMLTEKGLTLAVAESCSGGLITHRLTNLPGASKFLLEGLVTYSNASKIDRLGVREETLQRYGAVSEETAREMAEGVRQRANADIGVSVTGIAGPDGGTAEKPVGLVYVAIATAGETGCRREVINGDRARVKLMSSQIALDGLRRLLQGKDLNRWALPQGNQEASSNR